MGRETSEFQRENVRKGKLEINVLLTRKGKRKKKKRLLNEQHPLLMNPWQGWGGWLKQEGPGVQIFRTT